MKKILLCVILFVTVFSVSGHAADCDFNGNIANSLDNCLSGTDLVDASGDTRIETGVKDQIVGWTLALAQFLGLLAVGAIVYGGLIMTLSSGEDEKIKKGKDIVKWSLLGFLAVITTGALIRLVVEVLFSLTS